MQVDYESDYVFITAQQLEFRLMEKGIEVTFLDGTLVLVYDWDEWTELIEAVEVARVDHLNA